MQSAVGAIWVAERAPVRDSGVVLRVIPWWQLARGPEGAFCALRALCTKAVQDHAQPA